MICKRKYNNYLQILDRLTGGKRADLSYLWKTSTNFRELSFNKSKWENGLNKQLIIGTDYVTEETPSDWFKWSLEKKSWKDFVKRIKMTFMSQNHAQSQSEGIGYKMWV